MRERMARFMSGRYGMDHLGRFLNIVALVFLALSLWRRLFATLALAAMIYQYMRVFSRNGYKRAMENNAYLTLRNKVTHAFSARKARFDQRKDYRFYRCPECRQTLRVPKGKGMLSLTCPKCRKQFQKKT